MIPADTGRYRQIPASQSTIVCNFSEKYMIQTQENGQKPSKTAKQMRFLRSGEPQHFFSKIGLRHFSPLTLEQLHAKNLRNPMMGSMRTFVTDRQTDGRTDGPGYIGPAPISGAGPKMIKIKPSADTHNIYQIVTR